MGEHSEKQHSKKDKLKHLIKKLHKGADPEKMKKEFQEIIGDSDSTDIASLEEELIKEGMPQEEIHRLCDVHLAVFRESLEKEKVLAPQGHPVHTLMEEHKILLGLAGDLQKITSAMKDRNSASGENGLKRLATIRQQLKDSESHYVREENVLFPYLEKHGITQPPAMMWIEHDKIREIKKTIYKIIDAREDVDFGDFITKLNKTAIGLAEMLANHFYKENNILFPTALKVIPEPEWPEIKKQFDELGYCCFTPETAKIPLNEVPAKTFESGPEDMINFETGNLSKEEMETILDTLPVDITFVDKDNTVRYFSQSKDRIFPRTKAVIGRQVQHCHPQKSLHVVNKILEDFRNNKQDTAEFWINMDKKMIYIRYFAVRSKNGEYLGCLEVTQDIAPIKKIEGEKRLL